jgi:HCOMODA/2-hydroxy-3-carboxy-muconic semialdehyde decarboxylase
VSSEIVEGARALARLGLVDAFGHLSARTGQVAVITPPQPLSTVRSADLLELPLGELDALPAGLPGEAWIHWAFYRARPDVGAVCRAQPPSALPWAALADELPALNGQAALVGAPVPVLGDGRLIRDRRRAEARAAAAGTSLGIVLRGNGAVTLGRDVGAAVARMLLLERSAEVNLRARAAGNPRPLDAEAAAAWQAVGDDLLGRLWAYLRDDQVRPAADR